MIPLELKNIYGFAENKTITKEIPFRVLGINQNNNCSNGEMDYVDIISLIPIFENVQFGGTFINSFGESYLHFLFYELSIPDTHIMKRIIPRLILRNDIFTRKTYVEDLGMLWVPSIQECCCSNTISHNSADFIRWSEERQYDLFKRDPENLMLYKYDKSSGYYIRSKIKWYTRTVTTNGLYVLLNNPMYLDSSDQVYGLELGTFGEYQCNIGAPICIRIRI